MFRRDKDTRRTVNSIRTHELTMRAFGSAVGAAQKKNAADKADPWTNTGKDAAKDYREPMSSVKVVSPKKKNG